MKSKKLILMALTIVMVISIFAGCNKTTSNDTGTTKVPEGPLGKYEPEITLTSVRDIPNPAIVQYPDGDDIENNVWTRAIKEDLGINVSYLWTVDSSQLQTRINTMIASKQLPDFLYVPKGTYVELANEGLLADLTKSYNTYASDDVKRVYQEGGPDAMDSALIDGKMMGIPWISMAKEDAQLLWLRTDWLDNLGLQMPKNMDDLINIAIQFATKDPDKNGQNDTFGLPVNGVTDGGLMWQKGFFNGYGAYPFAWIEKNSKLVYGSIQPKVREALAKMAELYARKDSTIDLEFINKNYFSMYEPLSAGKYGIAYGPYYIAISPLQAVKTRNPKAEWKPVSIVSKSGEPAKVQTNIDVAGYWVVNKNCKNPDAVVKLINYWYQKFYFNRDNADYEKFINGPVYTGIYNNSPIISYRSWNNLEAYTQVKDVVDGKKTADTLAPIPRDYYNGMQKYKDGDNSSWSAQKCYEAVMGGLLDYKNNNLFMNDMTYFTMSDDVGRKFATFQVKEKEVFTKIIMGEYNISKFDELVNEWKRVGGDDVDVAANDWYNSIKK